MVRNYLKLILLSVPLVLICCSFSCREKPLEPVEPKDYPFYITDDATNQLFVFHPISKKLDSMAVPWGADAFVTASADGKLLYVALTTSVLVVDSKTLQTINELSYLQGGRVAASPDNMLVALLGPDLYILRTSDYSLVFSDTTEYLYSEGNFSSDSKSFYCSSRREFDSNGVVYRVDLEGGEFQVSRKEFPYGTLIEVMPSIDESKWFLNLYFGLWTNSFEVYDVGLDSIVFRDILTPGGGYHDVSPDGKYVFYTNAGIGNGPPPELSFMIYDVTKNQNDTVMTDTSYYGQLIGPPKKLAVTADSRWLGMLCGTLFLSGWYFYDIPNGEFIYRKGLDTLTFDLNDFRYISTPGGK